MLGAMKKVAGAWVTGLEHVVVAAQAAAANREREHEEAGAQAMDVHAAVVMEKGVVTGRKSAAGVQGRTHDRRKPLADGHVA